MAARLAPLYSLPHSLPLLPSAMRCSTHWTSTDVTPGLWTSRGCYPQNRRRQKAVEVFQRGRLASQLAQRG